MSYSLKDTKTKRKKGKPRRLLQVPMLLTVTILTIIVIANNNKLLTRKLKLHLQ